MKKFCTVIPISDRASLFKDPCTIPVQLAKYGYDCTFVSFIDISNLTDEEKEYTNNIHLVQLMVDKLNYQRRWCIGTIYIYIWNNAKKIDILNLYFLKNSILYGILYKLLNPHGFLYLKLDIDGYGEKKLDERPFQFFRRFVYRQYLRNIPDLVSAENTFSYRYIYDNYLPNENKLKLVYNGIEIQEDFHISDFEKRDNLILVVGRIGTHQKNHEMILESATKIKDWKDWKICFIGPINPEFSGYLKTYFAQYPELRNNIQFIGPVYNRVKLYSYYNSSKVLCMSSRYESFGIVYAEAQYFGNYIVSTDVVSLYDFIENNQLLGSMVSDSISLASTFSSIITGENDLSEGFAQRILHGKRFQWTTIIKNILPYFE